MESNTHHVLDIFQHLWAYISGFFLTMLAGLRLWWYDRKETKKMITDNAQAIVLMNENMVTQSDLQTCRDDVRAVDEDNLEKIFTEIKQNTSENARQHQDIMKQIVRLHK